MILCKVLNESAAEVPALLTSKIGMKHSGVQLEAMAAIAKASKIRSLEDFQAAVSIEVFLSLGALLAVLPARETCASVIPTSNDLFVNAEVYRSFIVLPGQPLSPTPSSDPCLGHVLPHCRWASTTHS
jgi:hypothetical protein